MPRHRIVVDAGVRAHTIAERRRIGRLQDSRIQAKTLRRYLLAVGYFYYWASLEYGFVGDTWDSLDDQIVGWIEALWQEGDSRSIAADTLSGIQHLLNRKRVLTGGWRMLRAWERREIPARAPPLPAMVLVAMAGFAKACGRNDIAILLLLGFHTMLRTCELLTLTGDKIALNADNVGVLGLEWTKMGQRRGVSEYVTIDDAEIGRRLAQYLRNKPRGVPLLLGSSADFRKMFNDSLAALKLEHAGYRPYSLRRGGASFDFVTFGDLQRTMARGRWMSVRVARIYIVDGWQLLNSLSLSVETRQLCDFYTQYLLS